MLAGYTINRVTLFALILAIGLLVDDPITGIDNIERLLTDGRRVQDEGGSAGAMSGDPRPLVMSTVAIILAFAPMLFITGMMGPYMGPMAFNVPVTVVVSTLVAFLITPWLARRLVARPGAEPSTATRRKDARLPDLSAAAVDSLMRRAPGLARAWWLSPCCSSSPA
ncbi:MAG: efflux RND transporter permease subunit [Gammaproteobacteria bacterium]|nr:efflux RND transporter permease subunit [Gammaproteobacteria bacterium]